MNALGKRTALLMSLLALTPGVAAAQYGHSPYGLSGLARTGPTISAAGTATIQPPAGAVRVHVELIGKGRSLEDALAALKDLQDAARAQLEALGAEMDSVSFSDPTLSNIESAQRKQFEMMIQQRMISQGKAVPKGLRVPKSFAVSSTLSAEWPLTAEAPGEVLVEVEALKEKVKAADLSGSKQAKALSPEEEELAEEMAEAMANSGEEPLPVGQPVFAFVARITDEERDRALAEAFARAKNRAERLAAAAGATLGPLVGLGGGGSGISDMSDAEMYMYRGGFGSYGYEQQQYLERLMSSGRGDGEEKSNETMAGDPAGLRLNFSVSAAFALEEVKPSPD